MSEPLVNQPALLSNGIPCRRRVPPGVRFCYQHAVGWRAKWRALPANKWVVFWIGIIGVVLTALAWVFPEFWIKTVLPDKPTHTIQESLMSDENRQAQAIDFMNRGVAHRHVKQWLLAIHDYYDAIRLKPDWAEAYEYRGFAKCQLSRCEEAIEDFNTALKINSNSAATYYNRGVAELRIDQPQPALNDLNTAIRLNPELAGAYLTRATTRKKLGDMKGAEQDLR